MFAVASGFVSAPSVPISDSSPFLGAAPTPLQGQLQDSTYWDCGGLLLNVRTYRSLWLAVTGGMCNQTDFNQWLCAGVLITSDTYKAIDSGDQDFPENRTCTILVLIQNFAVPSLKGDMHDEGIEKVNSTQVAVATSVSHARS